MRRRGAFAAGKHGPWSPRVQGVDVVPDRDYLHTPRGSTPWAVRAHPRRVASYEFNGMPRIFVSQSLLDAWITGNRTRLDGDLLRLPVEAGPLSLYLSPAVHIERIDGHDVDPHGLVGTVRSAQELSQMGAELYDTSVILGECAYSARPGFLAIPVGEGGVEAMFDATAWSRLVHTLGAMAG